MTHAFVASPAFVRSSVLIQPQLNKMEQRGKTQWQHFSQRMIPLAQEVSTTRLQVVVETFIVAMVILNIIIMTPLLNIFWADHLPSDREKHIQQLLAMIPPNASVSASDNLNPHLSERLYITVFPATTFSSSGKSQNESVQYIIVDLNALFPEERVSATNELNQLRQSGQFRNLAQAEGVILLVRVGT
jgi:hypothetical protein